MVLLKFQVLLMSCCVIREIAPDMFKDCSALKTS